MPALKPRSRTVRSKFTQTREPVVPKFGCLFCDRALVSNRRREHDNVCDPCFLEHVVPLM